MLGDLATLVGIVIGLLVLITFFVAVSRLGTISESTKKMAAILGIVHQEEVNYWLEEKNAIIADAQTIGDKKRARELGKTRDRIKRDLEGW